MARILIVDDDPDVRLATRLCLESGGHQTIEACCGSEALDLVKADPPDLIVLDVMMDTPTEGFQVALKLRSPDARSEYASFSTIPIILLTAIHTTVPLRIGLDPDYLPADVFMEKPLEPARLIEEVDRLLGRREDNAQHLVMPV